MRLLALGGPLNGQMMELGNGRAGMSWNAQLLPESYKAVFARVGVDIEKETRLIVTRYHPHRITFALDGLHLVGEVLLWEELDRDDPAIPRLALGHIIAGAMKI